MSMEPMHYYPTDSLGFELDSYDLFDPYLPELSDDFWESFEDFHEAESSPCDKMLNKKKPWLEEEDQQLLDLVDEYGSSGHWMLIGELMLTRNGKQCRERYKNHLSPEIKKDDWSKEEDDTINQLYGQFGSHWVKYRDYLPGRTDHAVKNRWHRLKRNEQSRLQPKSRPSVKRSNSQSSVGSFVEEFHAAMKSVEQVVEGSTTSESNSCHLTPRNFSESSFGGLLDQSEPNGLQGESLPSLQVPSIPASPTSRPLSLQSVNSSELSPTVPSHAPSLQIILPVGEYLDSEGDQRTPASMMSTELPSSAFSPNYRPRSRSYSSFEPDDQIYQQSPQYFSSQFQSPPYFSAPIFSPSIRLLVPESRQMEGLSPCLVYPAMMYFSPAEYSPALSPNSSMSPHTGYYTAPLSAAPTPMPPSKRNKTSRKKGKFLEPPPLWKGSFFAQNESNC